jgi:hypothetical protein
MSDQLLLVFNYILLINQLFAVSYLNIHAIYNNLSNNIPIGKYIFAINNINLFIEITMVIIFIYFAWYRQGFSLDNLLLYPLLIINYASMTFFIIYVGPVKIDTEHDNYKFLGNFLLSPNNFISQHNNNFFQLMIFSVAIENISLFCINFIPYALNKDFVNILENKIIYGLLEMIYLYYRYKLAGLYYLKSICPMKKLN